MGKRAGSLSDISVDAAEMSASGLEFSQKNIPSRLTAMKNVEMRMRRRNYVIVFQTFK